MNPGTILFLVCISVLAISVLVAIKFIKKEKL